MGIFLMEILLIIASIAFWGWVILKIISFFIDVSESINEKKLQKQREIQAKSRAIERKRKENIERRNKEKKELEERRKAEFLEKEEKTKSLNWGKIILSSHYNESQNTIELNVILKEENNTIIEMLLKSGFILYSKYSGIYKLKSITPYNQWVTYNFFSYCHIDIVKISERPNHLPKNIKYINYIDDNEGMTFNYLNFYYKGYYWIFDFFLMSYSIRKDSELPFNDYMLRRSEFMAGSLGLDDFILAQYILSQNEKTFTVWLDKANRYNVQEVRLENIKDSAEFKLFMNRFKNKWGFS